ncbi:MAG: hypothetical protein ACFFAG_00305 [Promethearchaeota archaeon]
MKKTSYPLIGLLLISLMIVGSIGPVRGTTYSCTGVVGAEATWRVKTVHNGTLTSIFGSTWFLSIQGSFGPGSHQLGAKMKTKVVSVDTSATVLTFEACNITSDIWTWTTLPFGNVPNVTGSGYVLMHPENLTYYCQIMSPFPTGNVSQVSGFGFLNFLPIPADTYLSELLWDNDYTISGTTVTHNVAAFYTGLPGVTYLVNCVESWRYSSAYGTFLGYKLVHNNGTIAYETELETPSAGADIPGFEIPVLLGVSMGIIISLIYVVMKKKQ